MIAADLLDLPQNPAPIDARIVRVETMDGATLRTAWWRPEGAECPGTICILQGRAEYIEKHFEVIGELIARGFAVVAFDWRGQGRSTRQTRNPHKGHIGDFSDYHRDMAAIEAEILRPEMPQPHYALAFSMGGAIALDMAAEGKLPFKRVVAIAPMLKISFIRKLRLATFTARLLCALGLGRAFVPFGKEASVSTRPFPGNRLSSDPVRYMRSSETASAMGAAAIGAPTIGWVRAAFRLLERLSRKDVLQAIQTPFLLLSAGEDSICDSEVIEKAASQIRNCAAIRIPGSRHEMLLESDAARGAFWAAFDAFIPGTDER